MVRWGLARPGLGFCLPSFSARKTKIRWLVKTWNLLSLVERAISMTDSGITPLGYGSWNEPQVGLIPHCSFCGAPP